MARRAAVKTVRSVAPGVLEIALELVEPAPFDFRPGQFITVLIDPAGLPPDPMPSGKGPDVVRRAYSIASSPADLPALELLVKLVPEGPASHYFARLGPGDTVDFIGPSGFFTAADHHPGDTAFGVTGSGIAAALPIIREILEREGETGRVVLYWGLRREEDVYWQDRLRALQERSPRFHYEICLSQPGAGWAGATGRLHVELLAAFHQLREPVFYLVGNGAMVREMMAELQARGVDRRKQIRREVFYPATEP